MKKKLVFKFVKLLPMLFLGTTLMSCVDNEPPPPYVRPKKEEPPIPVDNDMLPLTKQLMTGNDVIKEFKLDSVKKVAEGIEYTHIRFVNKNEGLMSMYVLSVDLANPNLTMQALAPYNDKLFGLQKTSEMAKYNEISGQKIMAAINGDAFAASGETTGTFIFNDYVRKTNTSAVRPYFGLTKTGEIIFQGLPTGETNQFPIDVSTIRHLVGGTTWLIYNNHLITQTDVSVGGKSSLGMTAAKKLYAIIVDGVKADYSNGISFSDLQKLYTALGVKYAMGLDGASSTTLAVRDLNQPNHYMVNRPAGNTNERLVGNAIGFVQLK